MKSNSLKEKFNNFNFNSKLKTCLIVSLCLILIGIIIVLIFNFNLGVDFTGGKVINIETNEILNDSSNYNKLTPQIKTILSSEGFTVKSIQQQADGEYSTIVVKFTQAHKIDNIDEALTNVQTKLETTLKLNNETLNLNVSAPQNFDGHFNKSRIIYTILAIILTIVLVLIYLGIRFKLLNALTTIIILCHDILLTLSLTVLLRIEINSGYLISIFSTIIISLICSILLFEKLRENKLREIYSSESSQGLANITIKNTFMKIMLILMAFLLITLIILIASVNSVRLLVLPIILGIIVVGYSSTMLTLPLWSYLAEKFPAKK